MNHKPFGKAFNSGYLLKAGHGVRLNRSPWACRRVGG